MIQYLTILIEFEAKNKENDQISRFPQEQVKYKEKIYIYLS
jgi:hypothetical protein